MWTKNRCKYVNITDKKRCLNEALPFHDYCVCHTKKIDRDNEKIRKKEIMKKIWRTVNEDNHNNTC